MKLNWAERLVVNNPVRVMIQRGIIKWIKGVTRIAPQARVLEIGCGRGAWTRLIQEEFHPGGAARLRPGLPDDPPGRELSQGEHRDRIALYVGDVLRLPYRGGLWD